ncbi:MAG: helix-turn-helix transcriptional regulator [Firmicutes bacterium]|nr:helix-turn-helix transcriptional regulator [Bacillota bacterium]
MGIARNVLKCRNALNLTQEELANKVGATQVFISHIEKGYKIPGLELTKRIAEALETTVDELIS